MRCDDIEFDNGFFRGLRSEPVCFFKTIRRLLTVSRYFQLYICLLLVRTSPAYQSPSACYKVPKAKAKLFLSDVLWCPCDGPSIFNDRTRFLRSRVGPRKSCAEFQFKDEGSSQLLLSRMLVRILSRNALAR